MVRVEIENVNSLRASIVPATLLLALLGLSLYLLNSATQNPDRFDELYPTLLVISGAELVILIIMIGANLARLIRQYRNRATGSRLSVRLIVMFVILSMAPVLVVYYFSVVFLSRGIDNWFDVRVDSALDSAIKLSRASLDERKRERLKTAQRLASELAAIPNTQTPFMLDYLREQTDADELTLLTLSGRIIASSSINPTIIIPNQPHSSILQQLRQGHSYVGVDPMRDGELYIRVVVPVSQPDQTLDQRVLHGLFPVATRISDLALAVQTGYAQYEELSYMREPLKFSFILTLSLVLLLTLFSAFWAAFHSARRLVAPIALLAVGTRMVSAGEYGKRLPLPFTSKDELGVLVNSFNDMTQKIAEARDEAAQSQHRAEEQQAYLEAVLGRLSSGVLVLDQTYNLRIVNAAANQILDFDLGQFTRLNIDEISERYPLFSHFANAVTSHLKAGDKEWREEVTFFGATGRQVLMCRGTQLLGEGHMTDHVIVFDDITALIQAQRDSAWGEVARRLAHEIKNPLTPIQLSAERLRHKYLATMEPQDATVLDRATHTIVQQVEVMKEMVKAFSDYARSPKLKLKKIDLNRLIEEVLDLYGTNDAQTPISMQLEPKLPLLEADSGRLRQLLLNLITNALELRDDDRPVNVTVATKVVSMEGVYLLELSVSDDGPGIPTPLLGRLFEPYVTTKPKGSGLGLAIVKKIVEEHGGAIRAANNSHAGACFSIHFPLEATTAEPTTTIVKEGKTNE